jgi:hypothetical protein
MTHQGFKALSNLQIGYIENRTDYDILNHNEFTMDVISRAGNEGGVISIEVLGLNHLQIIEKLKAI